MSNKIILDNFQKKKIHFKNDCEFAQRTLSFLIWDLNVSNQNFMFPINKLFSSIFKISNIFNEIVKALK